MFGMPDTVLGRAGQKVPLGRAAGNDFLSGALQILLGDILGDATEDALKLVLEDHAISLEPDRANHHKRSNKQTYMASTISLCAQTIYTPRRS
jgi:hypothetical protein